MLVNNGNLCMAMQAAWSQWAWYGRSVKGHLTTASTKQQLDDRDFIAEHATIDGTMKRVWREQWIGLRHGEWLAHACRVTTPRMRDCEDTLTPKSPIAIDVINVFYVFIQVTFFTFLTFFLIFPRFFIFKKRCQMQSINMQNPTKYIFIDLYKPPS